VRPWRSNRSSRALAATLSGALATVATAFALVSAWHSIRHVHRTLETERVFYASLTPAQRRREPVTNAGFDGQIFDFFDSLLTRGDRVYFQVMPSGFSSDYDLPTIVQALGRYYFLPAMQTSDLARATVVVSYFADPSLLHVKFVTQVRAGLQPLWVSRIKAP
jgi:hypothetical protein